MVSKKIIIGITIVLLLNIFVVVAEFPGWPAYNSCCEKTKSDAWCQNAMESDCDTSIDSVTKSPFRATPTSCESTSYCKLGCCINTAEGQCMENSPQRVCQISGGSWVEDAKCNVPQCSLGCCLIGDQASLITLTRCKRISALYGLNTNFKKEITNEAQCLINAYSQDRGACVYDVEGMKTCKLVTRQECLDTNKSTNSSISNSEFFKDYLCTADDLGTNCGPTTETICVKGRDEVYFKDTCGNPANIYDSSKTYSKNPGYWKKIVAKVDSCGYKSTNGNQNSRACGNCNYIKGSICGKGDATYGDNICKDLNCYNTQNGNSYRNGESWCVYQGDVGTGLDLVGSRHFRHVCIQGVETIEPCADFRNEVCKEEQTSSYYGDFIEAGCRVNRWDDCIDQFEEEDCLNFDKRDCFWVNGSHYDGSASKNKENVTVEKAEEGNDTQKGILIGGGICLPNVPPGLKFWEGSDSKSICSLGNSRYVVMYHEDIFGSRKCKENCEVLDKKWGKNLNDICRSLGDCGAYYNIAGKYTDDGVVLKVNGKKKLIEGVMENVEASSK